MAESETLGWVRNILGNLKNSFDGCSEMVINSTESLYMLCVNQEHEIELLKTRLDDSYRTIESFMQAISSVWVCEYCKKNKTTDCDYPKQPCLPSYIGRNDDDGK